MTESLPEPQPVEARVTPLLTASLGLLRERIGPLVAVAGVPVAISALISALWSPTAPPESGAAAVRGSGAGIFDFLLMPLALAAAYLVLTGRVQDTAEGLRAAVRRWPRALGAFLLSTLVTLLPMVPGMVVLFFAMAQVLPGLLDGMGPGQMPDFPEGAAATAAVGGLLMLLGFPVSVFLGLALFLAVPLAVVEDVTPVATLRESWQRMRGERWRTLGVGILLALLIGLPALIVAAVLGGLVGMAVPALGRWLAEFIASLAWVAGVGALGIALWGRTVPDRPAQPPEPPEAAGA